MLEWLKRQTCRWGTDHWPEKVHYIAPMSITIESRCQFCHKRIGQDSQGGWFLMPDKVTEQAK